MKMLNSSDKTTRRSSVGLRHTGEILSLGFLALLFSAVGCSSTKQRSDVTGGDSKVSDTGTAPDLPKAPDSCGDLPGSCLDGRSDITSDRSDGAHDSSDIASDIGADGSGPVPCPTDGLELTQEQADEIRGKPCHEPSICGGFLCALVQVVVYATKPSGNAIRCVMTHRNVLEI